MDNLTYWLRYEDNELAPVHVSRRYGSNFAVDLLLLQNSENNYHYVLIENLCKMVMFVQKQPFREGNEICRKCFHICTSIEIMKNHQEMCYNTERLTIKLPKPTKNQKVFKNLMVRWFAPRVIYFDLESIIFPAAAPARNPATSNTQTVEIHKPCSYVACSFVAWQFNSNQLRHEDQTL